MITQETAARIFNAYREIEAGEKLLSDMKELRQKEHLDKYAPTIRDAFGRPRHLQLSIPSSGDNSHRLLDVSPMLAESCIRAHIAKKQVELVEANEQARVELQGIIVEKAE